MLQNLNSTYKGLVTGLLMIAVSLSLYYSGVPAESQWQFSIYAIYIAGVTWSIDSFCSRGEKNDGFGNLFLQGFRCFIVVTLLMVIFTWVFNKMHPEFANQMADAMRTDLQKGGNKTPAEIDTEITKMKNYYLPMLVSTAVFGYLLLGAIISAVVAFLFMNRN